MLQSHLEWQRVKYTFFSIELSVITFHSFFLCLRINSYFIAQFL